MSHDYFIDDLPTQLSANSIGVLTSIGVHALLAFGFPNVPLFGGHDEKPISNNTTVPVIELNALEQSRLPNLAPPSPNIPTNIPAFPNTPIANIPIPNISSSSFFFPPGGRQLPSPSTPKLPPSPPPSINYNLPPLSGPLPGMSGNSANVWQNLPPTQTRLPGKISIPPKRTSIDIPLPSTNKPNDDRTLVDSKKRQELFADRTPDVGDMSFEKPSTQKPKPTSSQSSTPQQDSNNSNNSTDRNDTSPKTPATSSSATSKRGGIPNRLPPGQIPEPGQDELASLPKSSPSPIPAPISNEEREQRLKAEISQRGRSLQEDKTNTTDEEARKNYVNWVASTKQVKPTELNIAGTYPKDACIKKLEGTAVYGVVANTQGRATNLELIKSSGYPVFNQQAKQQIQSRRFDNTTGQPKAYRVNVNFDYSSKICPSLSLPQAKEPQAKEPTPAPTTKPTETPKTPESSESSEKEKTSE
jgi:TonB family protein